ncbi:MAG: metallophosphoesterase [Ignavibacteriaceae bacterium]|nr:metallophosphoesterase [Ignavibacteriaceae bacterium]
MIAVIGDIHGCFYTLKDLVDKIRSTYPQAAIYCVGDLVDRGNFSLETIDFIRNQGIIATSGNHDLMFYYSLTDPDNEIGKCWVFNGCETTMASYSNQQDKVAEHLNYVANLPLYINLEDCFISHAGVSTFFNDDLSPYPLSDEIKFHDLIKTNINREHGIIWNREHLMDLGKLQIVGHTRQNNVNHLKSNNVAYVDTSVYTGNKLSSVIVEEGKIINTLSVNTFPRDIEKLS